MNTFSAVFLNKFHTGLRSFSHNLKELVRSLRVILNLNFALGFTKIDAFSYLTITKCYNNLC
jgi:hypothetical protein